MWTRLSQDYNLQATVDAALNDSDKSFTVPASTMWEVLSIRAALATTATAGLRQLMVEFQDDSANVLLQIPAGVTQTVSLTNNYVFAPHLPNLTALVDSDKLLTPLPILELPPGYVVRVYDSKAIAAAADDLTVALLIRARKAWAA